MQTLAAVFRLPISQINDAEILDRIIRTNVCTRPPGHTFLLDEQQVFLLGEITRQIDESKYNGSFIAGAARVKNFVKLIAILGD